MLLPFSHHFPPCFSLDLHRHAVLLVTCLHPASGAGCSWTVAPFPAMPVQGAWPSPRFCHVHLPAQGCPHLPCPPGALNNSSLPTVAPGILCTYPATEFVCTWQSLHTQFHFTCDVAPALPCVSCVPEVMLALLAWSPYGRSRLPTPQTHHSHCM